MTYRMTSENILQKDWYEILGAYPSDSLQELRQNYQRLVLLYHPDKQSGDVPAGELEERVQRFIEVDQAWKILGNEETKREYDLQRRDGDRTQLWVYAFQGRGFYRNVYNVSVFGHSSDASSFISHQGQSGHDTEVAG
ncbi:dnaJ homolog subfamily C member 24 isoform X3 [Heptranchias perlo]|uniref:dnaJ homolog subfamily C member 24 isoform X3 n=1 Tax=Heptranchias perlo TaxID=212740 RepID=UPI00355A5E59